MYEPVWLLTAHEKKIFGVVNRYDLAKEFPILTLRIILRSNSRQEYIFTFCEYIDKNELTLPLYQRDVSWTLAKCVELLNYQLLSKSPISAISINIINNTEKGVAVPQVSFIEREVLFEIVIGQMSVGMGSKG